MNRRPLGEVAVRHAEPLRYDDPVGPAARRLVDSGLPALPVVNGTDRLCGTFGEREFFQAVFPGYLRQLGSAAFVTRSVDSQLERRSECRTEPVGRHMNIEPVAVGVDYSDAQLAETFLHHHVLIVPIVSDARVTGVVTRADFFRAVLERFEELA